MRRFWQDFWYKDNYDWSNVSYGGSPRGSRTFRWQRLYNILVLIIILISLYKIF